MKKKLILLSSFLFALGLGACSSHSSSSVGPNNGNGNGNGNGNDNPNGNGNSGYISDYIDSDGQLTDNGWRRLIKDSYAYCEDLIEQGSVLLKNENNCLPLKANERKITLFGNGSKNLFMRSGVGGAAPNESLVVDLRDALLSNGFNINETVYGKYSSINRTQMNNPSTTVENSRLICSSNVSDELADDVIASCDGYNDAAIVTFVRIGTEDKDIPGGMLNLTSDEQDILKAVKNSGKFSKTIVLINSPTPMSMDWADKEEYGVDAILYIGVPGYYGLGGVAHLLMGQDRNGRPLSPSGHLVETFAANASSSAAFQNFGDRNVTVYKEGVYVGYKYYETRYEDCILGQGNANGDAGTYVNRNSWNYADEMGYPFGYGLSYTDFIQKIESVNYNAQTDEYDVNVKVTNSGTMGGKASIQVYVQQPYTDFDKANGLGKSSIALMAYDKVDVEGGKSVTTTISFPRYLLATYDNKVNKGYILEGGDYYFTVGNGAHEALNNVLALKAPDKQLVDHLGNDVSPDRTAAKLVRINNDVTSYKKSIYTNNVEVTNQFDDADYNYQAQKNNKNLINYLDRRDWQSTWPVKTSESPAAYEDLDMSKIYNVPTSEKESYSAGNGVKYNVTLPEPITFNDMVDVPLEGKVASGKFQGQEGAEVWDKFISQMSLDDLVISIADNRGILDVIKIRKKGNSIAEGPEGILGKFQFGDQRWATGFPTGPVYTGTWDHKMQKKYGSFFGDEALFCGISCMNGPKTTIKRSAYTSRGSEYMSEDGILNYYTASNVVGAARDKGLIMNIGDCLLGSQESGRVRLQVYANEQAIREIYLKGFEGALTKGRGLGLQTSYNRIGTTFASCHKPLLQNVLRGEWGYKGLIIDSASTGSNTDTYSNGPSMLYAGIDIFCLDGARGGHIQTYINSNDDGTLLKSLLRANKNIMYALSRSSMGGITVSGGNQGSETTNPGGNTQNPNNNQPAWNPITNAVKTKANQYNYSFNPSEIVIPQENNYDYQSSQFSSLTDSMTREGHYLVYYFEGSYTEGYQGQYNEYYAHIYLWDDGLMFGKSHNQTFKGYWYNDSNGDGKADCLNMVSNTDKFSSIVCSKTNGFYDYEGFIYLNPGWGDGRSIIVSGYLYYPDVDIAIYLPNDDSGNSYKAGDSFNPSLVKVYRILKNLKYGVVSSEDVNINVPSNMLDSNNRIKTAGTYIITAQYKDLTTTRTITVAA